MAKRPNRHVVKVDVTIIQCDEIVAHLVGLRRTVEGFYDTAVTEAVEFESRQIVPMPSPAAYQRRCAEGLA
ncbi:MAG: hypothetical protein AAFV88_24655 [Planctomycetota bacterium]